MPRHIIATANAPASPLYSQAVKSGPFSRVSGMTGIDPSTGKLAGSMIQDQTRQALTAIHHLIRTICDTAPAVNTARAISVKR